MHETLRLTGTTQDDAHLRCSLTCSDSDCQAGTVALKLLESLAMIGPASRSLSLR